MLIELNIVPIGGNLRWRDQLTEVVQLAESLGLPYQLTPVGTRLEGDGERIMMLVQKCFERLCLASPIVLTTASIENDGVVWEVMATKP